MSRFSFKKLSTKLSLTAFSSTLQDAVSIARDPTSTPDQRRHAVWTIRSLAEKQDPGTLIRLGVVEIMLDALHHGSNEERLWCMWVIRRLSAEPETAVMLLAQSECIGRLVAVLQDSRGSRKQHRGKSETAKRAMDTFAAWAKYEVALALLLRRDVFCALELTMGSPDVSEAVQALRIYHDLAMAASEDDYLAMCASKEALGVLEALSTNKALQRTDKALASMVLQKLREPSRPASKPSPARSRAAQVSPHIPGGLASGKSPTKWSQFLLSTFEGRGPAAEKLLYEALHARASSGSATSSSGL